MFVSIVIASLMQGAIYGGVGMGFSLIYKASGLFSLAQGDMLMLGAFIGLTYFKILALPFIPAFLLTLVTMFIIGLLLERYLVDTLVKKGSQLAYIILLTSAISLLLQNAAMLIWATNVQQFPSIFSVTSIKFIADVYVAPEQLVVIGVAVTLLLTLVFFLNKTKFGTSMRAAALDQKAASAVGINVPLTKAITWGIAAAMAGSLGCCVGPLFGVYAAMGINFGQKGFAGAVVGGFGNIYGAVVGGLFFGFLEQFITAYISSTYKDLISFAVLIVVLIIMPTGIFRAQVLEE